VSGSKPDAESQAFRCMGVNQIGFMAGLTVLVSKSPVFGQGFFVDFSAVRMYFVAIKVGQEK